MAEQIAEVAENPENTENAENTESPENTENAENSAVSRVEDIEPLTYGRLMDRTLYKFTQGLWDYSDDRIGEVFINKFGKGFDSVP